MNSRRGEKARIKKASDGLIRQVRGDEGDFRGGTRWVFVCLGLATDPSS